MVVLGTDGATAAIERAPDHPRGRLPLSRAARPPHRVGLGECLRRIAAPDRRGDPRQPGRGGLQPRGERGRRPDRPQAPVQPAAAGGRTDRRAAPRGGPGKRRPPRGSRRDIRGDRLPGLGAVPPVRARRIAPVHREAVTTSSCSAGCSRRSP